MRCTWALVPILLGGGERLFERLDGGRYGYQVRRAAGPPSVAHVGIARMPA